MNASNHPHFVTHLCYLVPSADPNLLSLITTTLKNYIYARYNPTENPMSQHQKHFLQNNIFRLFYQIYPQSAPVKVFKEIMHAMILVDYPWPGIDQIIEEDLQGSLIASVYFLRQMTKAHEYDTGEERKAQEGFIIRYFPRLETIIQKIFENYN